MKFSFVLFVAVSALSLSGAVTAAYANADDDAWIAKCISDNKNEEGATPAITKAYCTCMDNKMSSDETKSISTWEKSHPTERKACEKEAGWN